MTFDDIRRAIPPKRLASYLVKSVAVIAFLYAVSMRTPTMPAPGLATVWALLSLVLATRIAYHATIKKTFRQKGFQEGGHAASFNNGRVLCLTISYIASATCMAAILVESPTWNATVWTTVVIGIPLYLGISLFLGSQVKRELAPLLQVSYTARYSALLTGLLLCIAFAIMTFMQPAANYECAADAFMAAPRPFDGSPSTIMQEVGDIAALIGGLSSYALAKAAETSFAGYVILQVLVNGAAFFGIAGLLAVCTIETGELKRVFLDLERDANRDAERPVIRQYVVATVVLPLVLVVGFLAVDAHAKEVTSTREYTTAQELIRGTVSLVVYEYDGKYYNPAVVDELLAGAREASESLSAETEATLTPLINESFDARIANVDSYLDWYYSIFADWEHLASLVTGNAEEFAKQQLEARIEEGIDDSELNATLTQYLNRAENLKVETMAKLSGYEIAEPYPEWLVSEVNVLDGQIEMSLEPSQKFLDANERLGISAATGLIAGVIAKKLVAKMAGKTAFKAIAGRIGNVAAASARAAAFGPGPAALALVASIATDIGMQKIDELANRESYKNELVSAIEEQREEALATVRSLARTSG